MSKFVLVLALAAAIVGLDQWTKWLIQERMTLYESIPVIDGFFHITYVRNTGGAFGFLRDVSASVRLPFFLTMGVVAMGALLYFVRQVPPGQYLLLLALGAILGGALGNFLDRMTAGTVVDFLDVHYRGWHWPTFNVADSFISTGVTILLAHSLFSGEPAVGSKQ